MSADRALFNIRLIDTKFNQGKMVLAEMAISGGGTAGVNTCIVRHENLNCNETELYIFTQFCVKKWIRRAKERAYLPNVFVFHVAGH